MRYLLEDFEPVEYRLDVPEFGTIFTIKTYASGFMSAHWVCYDDGILKNVKLCRPGYVQVDNMDQALEYCSGIYNILERYFQSLESKEN